jgi:AraC-like DNA-binding protein
MPLPSTCRRSGSPRAPPVSATSSPCWACCRTPRTGSVACWRRSGRRRSTPLDDEGTGVADRVDLAFGYIFAHLGDADLRLADTARHVGMSESAFSRYFARVTGVTFADTVRRLRLAQAGKLLRGTTLPVAAIAHRVGYANLSNFNRQFRAHHGHTPRTHRG